MRMALPSFFNGAADFISALESSQFCEVMYTDPEFNGYKDICESALDGIMH